MSHDLDLLPLLTRNFWVSQDILKLERRRHLWPLIDALPQHVVPDELSCHHARKRDGEQYYGSITRDPYGERLKWTTVNDLMSLRADVSVQDNWQNRAVWAYLSHMPPDWQIVLYWH